MAVKMTSFNIDSEIMKKIKLLATEQEITQTELITRYLIQGLKNDGIILNNE